jgi:hypothetical protein
MTPCSADLPFFGRSAAVPPDMKSRRPPEAAVCATSYFTTRERPHGLPAALLVTSRFLRITRTATLWRIELRGADGGTSPLISPATISNAVESSMVGIEMVRWMSPFR